MRHIVFIGLMLVSIGVSTHAQNVDSLVNVLETQELTKIEQVELCYKIFERYVLSDLSKASIYAEKGLNIAEKENNKIMASKFNAAFGRIYNTKSRYDTALVYWDKALDLAVAAKDKNQEAAVYSGIAILYSRQEKNALALENFTKTLSIYESTGETKKCITVLSNIANIYRATDNDERAVYYLEKAKKIAEDANDADGKMRVYYALGAIYYKTGFIGNEPGKIDLALEYELKAYEISHNLNDKIYQGGIAEVLSAIYADHIKDYDQALKYSYECLQTAEEISDPRMILGAWNSISNTYRVQKRYKESEAAALKAWEVDSTNINMNINLLENIVLADIMLGDKNKASLFFQKYIDIVNIRVDQTSREALADMDVKYETEKKEMRIASLEKERQLYIWLGVAGVLLAVALGIALWQMVRNARKEKQLISTRSVLDGEMSERSRLARDLHDRLSGNLSAIKISLTDNITSLQNVNDRLDGCIEEIRRVAHNLMPASLQFGMKVALEDFAAQFSDVHFHFFGTEKRIGERVEFVIYCCANELVNNSIKHSGAKNINLQLVQTDKYVTLTVSDDGCGFDEKTIEKGFGLKSIRDRVTSCNGKIDIVTAAGVGTEITIEIKTENTW